MFDKKHLEEGIALRRNTYRGKKLELTPEFYKSIQNGTFDDIYVGDYIDSPTGKTYDTSNETVRWLIADIDNYMNTGWSPTVTQHHVTIIPAKPLMNAQMNEKVGGKDTTQCGYAGSDMVGILKKGEIDDTCTPTEDQTGLGPGSTLESVYTKYIKPDFEEGTSDNKSHVLTYQTVLTNKTDETATNNRLGNTSLKGASSGWEWYTRKLDLMSEMNVYGGIVASSSMYDTGIDNRQYAIFRLKPELMYSYNRARFNYWLKDVVSSTHFAGVDGGGDSSLLGAGGLIGVRPRFLIGEIG